MHAIFASVYSVLIFDDNTSRLDSLSMLINMHPQMQCIATITHANNAVEEIEKYKPNLVLMDIDMPGINGIDAVTNIKRIYPDTTIIMQTVFEDDDKIFKSIQAGASGYILKKTSPEKMLMYLEEARDGGAPMTASIANRVLLFMKSITANTETATDYSLTSREKEILQYLVDGNSYKMIAHKCNISFNTVNTHIKKIYDKLHVNSSLEAVRVAIKDKIV